MIQYKMAASIIIDFCEKNGEIEDNVLASLAESVDDLRGEKNRKKNLVGSKDGS